MRILHELSYERPKTLDEALALLDKHRASLAPLAGGTDLVVNMKMRSILQITEKAGTQDARWIAARRVQPIHEPAVVMSLADLPYMKGVRAESGSVWIGPSTTMTELASSSDIPTALAALADAAAIMGSPLIRNRATVGGNIMNARPAADTAVAFLSLGGKLSFASRSGTRSVDIDSFFTGPGTNVRRDDELLVGLQTPYSDGEGSAYARMANRRQLEIALVGAAAWLRLDPPAGTVTAARIALGAVGPTPMLAPIAASVLTGSKLGAAAFAVAAKAARDEVKPIDDFRGGAAYRLELVETLVQRALEKAATRALGRGARA